MYASSTCIITSHYTNVKTQLPQPCINSFLKTPANFRFFKLHFQAKAVKNVESMEEIEAKEEEKSKSKWVRIGPDISEAQKQDIANLPPKMSNRCKALMKQIICFDYEESDLSGLIKEWVKSTIPRRADWLIVLKELCAMNHPLYLQVAELALLEESFETNIRDYTKIIHAYAKQNQVQEAENTVLAMKRRGFISDQVTLTALIHMYSKSGNLKMAEESFEEMKLLGVPLDRRSFGSIIMAYVRAGMFDKGEDLLREMDEQQNYAGKEVYKALLRAYSMIGDCAGAQRIFDATQLAGITPDVKLCALLINAYVVAGQSREACIAFDNMRKAGLRPNDKCVALILTAYQKKNKLNKALEFLIDLEKSGILLEKEASTILAGWFRSVGVVEEVELLLRDYESCEAKCEATST